MNALESVFASCPYCGEVIGLLVDCSIPEQRYIEDCEVCCRPIEVAVRVDGAGAPALVLRRQEEC